MAICLNAEHFGELVDYYGGKRDLQQKKVRFLHNISFIDDPTRMLRAIRFSERYEFDLAKETQEALYTAIDSGVLSKLSIERFTEEIMLIFKEKNYLAMGRVLISSGLFKAWFGEDYDWDFNLEDVVDSANWSLNRRWLIAISKMDSLTIEKLLNRVCLNKSLRDDTLNLVRMREALKGPLTLSEMDKLLNKVPKEVVMVLTRDDRFNKLIIECLEASQKINMSLDGKALLQMGVKEGPEIGEILDRVRIAWLEGRICTLEEEQGIVRQWVNTLRR
jgi:tRNA nucleotidyltransferase (CCA-adding enzyme)